jgi:hypothetical protein
MDCFPLQANALAVRNDGQKKGKTSLRGMK